MFLFSGSGGSGSIQCELSHDNVRFKVNIPKNFD